jgi:hypothetical protein
MNIAMASYVSVKTMKFLTGPRLISFPKEDFCASICPVAFLCTQILSFVADSIYEKHTGVNKFCRLRTD